MPAETKERPASELARQLVDSGAPPPALDDDERRALAWALKDACYAAWSSDPQWAARAADTLAGLRLPGEAGPLAREIAALAEWTAGIACLTRGRMTDAIAALDRAAGLFRGLGRDHDAARTQVPKIMALSMLGLHAEAADCAERTQREFVAHGDVPAAGKVALNLGSLHLRRDAYPQSARHYREAAVLFARVGDHQHSVMADIGVADAVTAMGDIDEALLIYERARMRAGAHGFPVLEAMVEESVALLQFTRGHYREALAGFEGSRRRYEALAMPQHLAIAEKQLGDAYLELRLLPEALALFDPALVKFEALSMPDDQAWTLAQRGRALALLGQSGPAAAAFVAAATLFAAQGNGVGEAAVVLARAELALAGGDAASAVDLARAAAQGFAGAGLAEAHARADVVHAYALFAAGRRDEAREQFAAVLRRARELELLTVQVRCLTGEGLAARAAGDVAAAAASFRAAIALFEEQRRALPGDEIRSAFLADHLRPYHELLRIALDGLARDASPAAAGEVLAQLDRCRARGFRERLDGGADGSAGGAADDDGTRALRARLNWLYRRVQRLQDDGEPFAAPAAELHSTERALLERVRRQRLAAPVPAIAPAPRQEDSDDLDVPALQAALGAGDALVEYGVAGDELFACVVTRAGVRVVRRIAAWTDVEAAVQSARFQLESLRHGAAPVQRHLATLTQRMQQRMRSLHALIWAPLGAALDGCRRVLVVPHAQLGALPFAALHDGEEYLARRFELAMAPSARIALRGLSRPPLSPRRALVLGESTRLPHAAAEARFVAGLFPGTVALTGADATLEALRSRAGAADVIHLACHAQFRADNPMFSALHLADGALTVEAAQSLSLSPGVVVLSACETALAEAGTGDEMVGLVRAFLVAGASRVLASLWPVDDAVTGVFMAHFYGALGRGETPAAALRHAGTALLEEHPHPFYWAAFTLQGGW